MPIQTYAAMSTVGFNASSSGETFKSFGFKASTVRVDCLGTVPLYIKFDIPTWTSCAATTNGLCVFACANQNRAVFEFSERVPVSTVVLWATSTAAGAAGYNIVALGL